METERGMKKPGRTCICDEVVVSHSDGRDDVHAAGTPPARLKGSRGIPRLLGLLAHADEVANQPDQGAQRNPECSANAQRKLLGREHAHWQMDERRQHGDAAQPDDERREQIERGWGLQQLLLQIQRGVLCQCFFQLSAPRAFAPDSP